MDRTQSSLGKSIDITPQPPRADTYLPHFWEVKNIIPALTTRNIAIAVGVGLVAWVVYRYLSKPSSVDGSSKSNTSFQRSEIEWGALLDEKEKSPERSFIEEFYFIAENIHITSEDGIRFLKENECLLTNRLKREMQQNIMHAIKQRRPEPPDYGFELLKGLSNQEAPSFLSKMVQEALTKNLEIYFFEKLQAGVSLEDLASELKPPTPFSNELREALSITHESLIKLISESNKPLYELIKTACFQILDTDNSPLFYLRAIILHVEAKKISCTAFVQALKNNLSQYPYHVLDQLNYSQYEDLDHWCIHAVRDFLPILIWDMSKDHLQQIRSEKEGVLYYVDYLELMEKLQNFKEAANIYDEKIDECLLAQAIVRYGESCSLWLKDLLSERTQHKELSLFVVSEDERLNTTYHRELRAANKLLREYYDAS